MNNEHYYPKLGTLGAVVAAAYLTLAGSSFFPQPVYAENRKGLESEVQSVHHGIKGGKYQADMTVVIRNSGSDITERLSWFYSLCFEAYFDKGKKKSVQCVAGKTEMLDMGLKQGEEQKRKVSLKKMGEGLAIDFSSGSQKKTVCIRGQKPKINIRLVGRNPEPIYERDHYLSPVGDYK